MRRISRREFLQSTIVCPYLAAPHRRSLLLGTASKTPAPCWLEVIIPFLIEDGSHNFFSEIVLPSGMFAGREGYASRSGATEYELLLYNQRGEPGGAERFELPPMHTRSVPASEISRKNLGVGAARVRMRPRVPGLTHFADLFSAAFVRWNAGAGSSYIHAYPDPPQAEVESYQSVLTLPHSGKPAFLSLFNPSNSETEALVEVFDDRGENKHTSSLSLKPYASTFYDLVKRKLFTDLSDLWASSLDGQSAEPGTVVVRSLPRKPKVFFFFLSGDGRSILTSEHPVLQGGYETIKAKASPFTPAGQFKAQALLFCPLYFKSHSSRGLILRSRAYLGAGIPIEEPQWIHPFVSGEDGQIYWSLQHDRDFCARADRPVENGVLRLHARQSFELDSKDLPLPTGFSGGLVAACSPAMNQTLMKIEVQAEFRAGAKDRSAPGREAVTYSHFRPGATASRRLLEIGARDGLLSDYIISGIQVARDGGDWRQDCFLALMNIEFDRDTEGKPVLELFGPRGFIARRELDPLSPLGCRYHWLSDLFPQSPALDGPLSLRLLDAHSVTIVSALHVDFARHQLSIDHGSDRFSTYLDYSC